MTTVKISELRLGDIVSLGDGPYMTATVKRVEPDKVTLFRPYVVTSDFSYTGGVICYIGTEIFAMHDMNGSIILLRSGEPLK